MPTTRRRWSKIIRQPATDDKDLRDMIFKPAAFLFTCGRLYVGYQDFGTFHKGQKPSYWDPKPVPFGAVIETCNGFFHFVEIQTDGPPYYRKYATVALHKIYKPEDDWGFRNILKMERGTVRMHEQITLPPDSYLECVDGVLDSLEWNIYSAKDARNLERRILRSPSLEPLRTSARSREIRRDDRKRVDYHPHGLEILKPNKR